MAGKKGMKKRPTIFDEYTYRDDLSPQQKWRLRNPDKIKKISSSYDKAKWSAMSYEERAEYHYKKKYNMTYAEIVAKLEAQNFYCPCCNGELDSIGPNRAVVDHCHSSNTIRDMLCNHCNKVLGLVYENTNTLKNMISYLEKWHGQQNSSTS